MPKKIEVIESKNLVQFIGGEVLIEDWEEITLLRGEISSIIVSPQGRLKIKFTWLALNRGGPIGSKVMPDSEWDVLDNPPEYVMNIFIYSKTTECVERTVFGSEGQRRKITLFPLNAKWGRLNPVRIHGLPENIRTRLEERYGRKS